MRYHLEYCNVSKVRLEFIIMIPQLLTHLRGKKFWRHVTATPNQTTCVFGHVLQKGILRCGFIQMAYEKVF